MTPGPAHRNRRQFIHGLSTWTFGIATPMAQGCSFFVTPALGSEVDLTDSANEAVVKKFDISTIEVGETLLVRHKNLPVAIRHRSEEEIRREAIIDPSDLPDRLARVEDDDETILAWDRNRTKPGREQWIVVYAVCTRDDCGVLNKLGHYEGWLCPCCSSHYDVSGRVRRGIAPRNLAVPKYTFSNDTPLSLLL